MNSILALLMRWGEPEARRHSGSGYKVLVAMRQDLPLSF